MTIPNDYIERVYAGVLGKIIGVYLGRPIEGWSYEKIMDRVGEVDHYLHEVRYMPLVCTDDDISGTFTFLRAMPDHGNDPGITPRQIGESWLNYILERKTILWWGGIGNSTEHTAYIRLKNGIPAPDSGSERLNGKLIAEQIGAQIFIDGWGMICPGDPERAADFARRAGSVSHDGEAIYGAQVVAAMEAQAFVESDLNRLLDVAVAQIPADSVIARLIHDVRAWHAAEPDWRKTRELIAGSYGYDKFGGNCHMVPNHALIIHALLHGEDDFSRSQMIVNTSGWDTDCNAANVGCIMGIKNGLAGIDAMAYDWRGPVADRMYLATADGGRGITDAVIETYEVVNICRALAGLEPAAPKGGARFHFEMPGSVQGFLPEGDGATVENVARHSSLGARSLAVVPGSGAARAMTATFIPTDAIEMPGYTLLASPTLYPGQRITARVAAGEDAARAALAIRIYGAGDALETIAGPGAELRPGETADLEWIVPDTGGAPIAQAGIEVSGGAVYLDRLDWSGVASTVLARPAGDGALWRRAWVEGVDQWEARWPQAYRIVQNAGTGLISQGTADWEDYRVSATVEVPLASEAGIAARVGGQRRWYGLLLCDDGRARIVRERDGRTVLAEAPVAWGFDRRHDLAIEVKGRTITGYLDGKQVLSVTDGEQALAHGGAGLVTTEGCLICDAVEVRPVA
ncbi:MAG: ADP-ribosylglycohydrolase family protein [Chloroflexota bacterium]